MRDLAIVAVFNIPFVVVGLPLMPCEHHIRLEFQTTPAEADAVLDWLNAQPGITNSAVHREGPHLSASYTRPSLFSPGVSIRWKQLGYPQVKRGAIDSFISFSDPGTSRVLLFAILFGTQCGMLAVAIRDIRSNKWILNVAQQANGGGRRLVVHIGLGAILGACLFVVGKVYENFLRIGDDFTANVLRDQLGASTPVAALAVLSICISGPLAEEMFFRGSVLNH